MLMQKMRIFPTLSTPDILLDPDGIIKIEGRSKNANIKEFSETIDNWVDKYLADPAEITKVDLYFEYLSTNNLIFYRSLLLKISMVLLKRKKYVINWIYDEGDLDIMEKGENISSSVGVDVNFIMIEDSFFNGVSLN